MRRSVISSSEAITLLDQWVAWANAFFRHMETARSRWQDEYSSGYQEENPVQVLPDGSDDDMERVDAAMTQLRRYRTNAYAVITHRHVNGHRRAYADYIYEAAIRDFVEAFNRVKTEC